MLQENIECDFEFVTSSPAAMVSLIEKPSQQSLVGAGHEQTVGSDPSNTGQPFISVEH